jgi:hypothetical protein
MLVLVTILRINLVNAGSLKLQGLSYPVLFEYVKAGYLSMLQGRSPKLI